MHSNNVAIAAAALLAGTAQAAPISATGALSCPPCGASNIAGCCKAVPNKAAGDNSDISDLEGKTIIAPAVGELFISVEKREVLPHTGPTMDADGWVTAIGGSPTRPAGASVNGLIELPTTQIPVEKTEDLPPVSLKGVGAAIAPKNLKARKEQAAQWGGPAPFFCNIL